MVSALEPGQEISMVSALAPGQEICGSVSLCRELKRNPWKHNYIISYNDRRQGRAQYTAGGRGLPYLSPKGECHYNKHHTTTCLTKQHTSL